MSPIFRPLHLDAGVDVLAIVLRFPRQLDFVAS